MNDRELEAWVTIVRCARQYEAAELRKKRRDTISVDLRRGWITAMRVAHDKRRKFVTRTGS
jgi:hypothetical protein